LARLIGLLLGAGLWMLPATALANGQPVEQIEAFLAAASRGDVTGAVGLLDERARYEGVLVCALAPCVGREAIAAALAYEAEDGTVHRLWSETLDATATTVAASGEMHCRSLAPIRLVYTVRAEVGPDGIASLTLAPDRRDLPTRQVMESVAAVQALLDEAQAAGFTGPVTFGGLPTP